MRLPRNYTVPVASIANTLSPISTSSPPIISIFPFFCLSFLISPPTPLYLSFLFSIFSPLASHLSLSFLSFLYLFPSALPCYNERNNDAPQSADAARQNYRRRLPLTPVGCTRMLILTVVCTPIIIFCAEATSPPFSPLFSSLPSPLLPTVLLVPTAANCCLGAYSRSRCLSHCCGRGAQGRSGEQG